MPGVQEKSQKSEIRKALTCKTCMSLVHRRCSGISNYDLCHLKTTHFLHWECSTCQSDKFAFNSIVDCELVKESFNSNFDCSCLISCPSLTIKRNLLLEMAKFDKDEKYGPDPENNIDKNFNLNVDFDYYTLHQFHKLVKDLNEKRKIYFSIYHSNIESLQCNFERLHTQLINLDHSFDIIALSEVWNPSSKKNSNLVNYVAIKTTLEHLEAL